MAKKTTEAHEDLNIDVKVEDSGPSRKKLNIEVPADVVSARLVDSLDTLVAEVELPGFRKGRAPKRLVEKKFGSTIRDEAKKQLISAAYSKAIEEKELKVIGEPTSEMIDKIEVEDGKALSFEVEVEVQPEFEMPSLEGIEIKKPKFEVTDERINEEIGKIAINEGDLEQRDEPEPGDYLTGNGVMTGPDGTEFYNIEGCVVRVPLTEDNGRGMILGVVVDDFSSQLGLPKPGESVTIKAKGPEHHENEDLRGVDLTVAFEVTRVDRIIPAEVPDVVARYGMESEDQLKDAVKSRLNQRGIVEQQTVMRHQIARHLLDNTEMELPERLTAVQAMRAIERYRYELMYRGVDQQEIERRVAEFRSSSSDRAQRELKLFFIINQAAQDLKVGVTEQEVNGRIAQMAAEQGQRPEELRQHLIQSGQAQQIVVQIREHKTIDAIIAKANVEEVSAEEFEKLAKEQAEAEHASA
ncbi:MAG: trigger factor [Phycisphaerae bacterium]|nr:trigger factor [Phycisphaerae bacterium]